MKSILTSLFFCTALSLNAQQSDLNFFTDDGQRFSLFLNGENLNPGMGTSVKKSVSPATYRVKIVFDHDSLGVVERTLPLEAYKSYTFHVKKKAPGAVVKDAKTITRTLHRNFTNPADTNKVDGEAKNKYALILLSEVSTAPANATPQGTGTANNKATGYSSAGSQSTTTTGTTTTTAVSGSTTTTQARTDNANISVNMNVGVPTGSATYHETTTTTTTTGGAATTQHYVMPGYNGPVGCPWPMNDGDFQSVKSSVSSKSFDDSRLQIAKQVIGSNCLLSSQVRDLMTLFSFEETRLDLAKYAYGYTYDIGNYYKVNDAFTFESSIDELNRHIQSRR